MPKLGEAIFIKNFSIFSACIIHEITNLSTPMYLTKGWLVCYNSHEKLARAFSPLSRKGGCVLQIFSECGHKLRSGGGKDMAAPHGPAPRERRYHFAPLSEWLAFFFGTGPRFLTSAFIVLVTLGVIFPQGAAEVTSRAGQVMVAALGQVLQSVFLAIEPFKQPIAELLIMILGFYILMRRIRRGGGRNRH